MVSVTGEYKGHKIIKLMKDESDKFGFTFGVQKGKLILNNIEDIKAFVEENENG